MSYLFVSAFTLLITLLISYAGSLNGPYFLGFPALILIGITGYFIHWLIFIPSFLLKSEKYYDITGTISYIVMISISMISVSSLNMRSKVIAFLVVLWALRLGFFLLIRVFQIGEDKRFKDVKTSFTRFFMWFNMSALWVFLTTANAITAILNNSLILYDLFFVFGISIWIIGFSIEAIADNQKRQFRKEVENKGKYISTGLWSLSRHPNYFGEILIWFGMAIIAFPTLVGWQYITLVSPLFVYLLLTRISGVNLLESSADKKWGSLSSYQEYKKETPILVPFKRRRL